MEDDDLDLPRGVSGPPNLSISEQVSKGYPISYLITDHFHLWEQGSGNYHMGCTGFDFIRGHEADAWHTDPIGFPIPEKDRPTKMERHFRNIHLTRKSEADWFSPQVFSRAVDWLERNHEHDSVGHIPFIVAHPEYGHGERRDQLVQLVDIYPTVLGALNRPTPHRHGVDLIPVLEDPTALTRDYAIAGQFGKSVTITDGEWVLHQSPVEENVPLYWYGHHLAKFIRCDLGPYHDGRREVVSYQYYQ